MGDVADILGLTANAASSKTGANKASSSRKKPEGMSREVFSLLSHNSGGARTSVHGDVPPLAPSAFGKGSKDLKRKIKMLAQRKAKPWVWSGFKNSARQDSYELHHWQKRDQVLADYPFARFNKGCVIIRYTSAEEYAAIPSQSPAPSPPWTREETDHLLDLCVLYDLRWDIVGDRYHRKPDRSITDLKFRYYHVAKHVISYRRAMGVQTKKPSVAPPAPSVTVAANGSSSTATASGSGSGNGNGNGEVNNGIGESGELKKIEEASQLKLLKTGKISSKARTQVENDILGYTFNVAQEQLRLSQLDQQHSRTASEEREEQRILAEIRKIDAQMKRLQKEKKTKKGSSGSASSETKQTPLLDNAIISDAKKRATLSPSRRRAVHLRSSRLIALPTSIGVGQRMLKKMSAFLTEVGIPERPLPTGTVCDAYDELRQDSMKLLSLKNQLQKLNIELHKLKGLPMPVKPKVMPIKAKSERTKKRKAHGYGNTKKSNKKSSWSSSTSSTTQAASVTAPAASAMASSQKHQHSLVRGESTLSTSSTSARTSTRVKKKKVK